MLQKVFTSRGSAAPCNIDLLTGKQGGKKFVVFSVSCPWYSSLQMGFGWAPTLYVLGLFPQVFQQAALDNFTCSPAVQGTIRNHFAAIGGTKLSEDCAQKGGALESTGGNANKTMRPQRPWDHLVSSKICSAVHEYQEVPWESMPIPRGMQGSLGPNLYKAPVNGVAAELKEIMGSSATTSWYSPSALSQCEQDLDLELAFACEATGGWDLAGDVRWYSLLKHGFGSLIRDSRWPGNQLFFCPWGCWVEWQAWGGQRRSAKLAVSRTLHWTLLQPWRASSPCSCAALIIGRRCLLSGRAPWQLLLLPSLVPLKGVGALALPSGKPEALLTHCAKKAFGKLPRQALLFIAKETGAPWADGDSLFQRPEKILKHLLPHLSHQAVFDIIGSRRRTNHRVFLTEDVSDMATKDQEEDINKLKEGMTAAAASQDAFKAECRRKLQVVRKAAVAQRGKAKASPRPAQGRGPTPYTSTSHGR